MSVVELYDVYYLTLGTLDRFFEFWMTASFSVVVAAFFLNEKMNRYIYLLLSIGYTLFSLSLGVRYFIASRTLIHVRDQLIALGEPFSAISSGAAGASIWLTFIFGLLGTLGYLQYAYSRQ